MPQFNLNESLSSLLEVVRLAAPPKGRAVLGITDIADSTSALATNSFARTTAVFPDNFRVPGVAYEFQQTRVPTQLVRKLNLSNRLLPTPSRESPDLSEQRIEHDVKHMFDIDPMARSLASGTLKEPNGNSFDFIAVSYTDAAEYWISIQGSLINDKGDTFSFVLEADGAAAAGSYGINGFENSRLDGGLLRLQPLSGKGSQVEETQFTSLHTLDITAHNNTITLRVSGDAQVNSKGTPIRLEVKVTSDTVTVEVLDEETNESVFIGNAPRDRVNVRVIGGLIPPQSGRISVLDRTSGQEVRQVPIHGRVAGAAWDGEYLWQTFWPQGEVYKIDIREGGGVLEKSELDIGRMVNGIAFSGDNLIMGTCTANVAAAEGGTALSVLNNPEKHLVKRLPRPHTASSGFCRGPNGILAVVSGIDQTPTSTDSAIVVLNPDNGDIEETVFFPPAFFIHDIDTDYDGFLLTVSEGFPTVGQRTRICRLTVRR